MDQQEFNRKVDADVSALISRAQSDYDLEQARERLALLNAGVPDPITSMDDAGYWDEKAREIYDDMKFWGEL